MDHKEAGQGTPFDSMTHETMLAWLDMANSGAIQGASDRLVSAGEEIRKIAEEIKVRPQTVEWKGEGADAFRTWSADLANATLRLGDYSEGASKWLARASDSLASAQVAIPRTDASAQANLAAAKAARNDPDASAVATKSLETLLAAKESNRQEAAAEMRKLAQSYALSASQMDGLEKPVFPPPPGAIMPERAVGYGGSETYGGPASGRAAAEGEGATRGVTTHSDPSQAPGSGSQGAPDASAFRVPPHLETPVSMEVNSTATLPQSPSTPPVPQPGPSVTGRSDSGLPTGLAVPPAFGGGTRSTPGPFSSAKGAGPSVRPPLLPGQGVPGAGSASRTPRDAGITGGRPVAQPTGRGLPGGTVVGGEGTQGRSPMGHGGMSGGGAARSGAMGGRPPAGGNSGVVGGRPRQAGRSGERPFTPGGTGLVRGNENGRVAGQAAGGLRAPSSRRPGDPRRDEGGERPDYLIEDEETWKQGGRRVTPPVIE
ncbi:WXG100 family type VII secretion target [Streptomyces atroolivaceus]|uniref:WXG100 family type VII secretion target n=1 Tax=Streptomyces atroolivaceus TaxID=66869 RepID=UPI00202400F8|nr:translation initiation factor IF-2 [Streptomyces atroolivaceus]